MIEIFNNLEFFSISDDFIQMIKSEIDDSDECDLMEEEMPSEVIHDNITEVVEMDFGKNL